MGNDSNSWRWSSTGETSTTDYHNWAHGEPNYNSGKGTCVMMALDGSWLDQECEFLYAVLCYNGEKGLVLVGFTY